MGLKKTLTAQDTKAEPPEKSPLPEMDDTEMTTETIRTRDDGSRYAEVLTPEGDIEIKELDKPKQEKKKKKAKAKPKAQARKRGAMAKAKPKSQARKKAATGKFISLKVDSEIGAVENEKFKSAASMPRIRKKPKSSEDDDTGPRYTSKFKKKK